MAPPGDRTNGNKLLQDTPAASDRRPSFSSTQKPTKKSTTVVGCCDVLPQQSQQYPLSTHSIRARVANNTVRMQCMQSRGGKINQLCHTKKTGWRTLSSSNALGGDGGDDTRAWTEQGCPRLRAQPSTPQSGPNGNIVECRDYLFQATLS